MKNKLAHLSLFAASLFLALEIAGFLSGYWTVHLYDVSTPGILEVLNKPDATARWHDFMRTNFSPVTGWMGARNVDYNQPNCIHMNKHYSHDYYRDRTYAGYRREEASVILAGDSYTYGDELNNDETVAARIYQQSGIVAANLGDRAYSPLQAVLRAQSEIGHFPQARMVILGIMYDDMRRLVSVNRAQIWNWNLPFMLSPYMRGGKFYPLDANAYRSLSALREAIKTSRQNDYWKKPDYRFPYSLAFVRALFMPSFRHAMLSHEQITTYDYADAEMSHDLFVLLAYYAQWAQREHLVPVVIFLPLNHVDIKGPDAWIAANRTRLPANLVIKNLDFSAVDPARYNILPSGSCHPSAYGALEIARQYVTLIHEHRLPLRDILYGPAATLSRPAAPHYDWQGLTVNSVHSTIER